MIDGACGNGLASERRAADCDVAARRLFEPSDRAGVKIALDPHPAA